MKFYKDTEIGITYKTGQEDNRMIIKNSNLRRDIFENRYKILAIIVAIILILCIIQALNEMAKQSMNTPKTDTTTNGSSYKPQETVIIGENVSEKKQEQNTKIMDEFINYCNEKEIEKAYNLLTDECKEELFSNNIENFKKNYIEKIFTTYKTYNMQSWINASNPTYKVRILQDALSTGKTGQVVEDYYTIVKKDGAYKLNLNSYIGRTKINKQAIKDNITITVVNKDTFMDYEIYSIKVENNTDNTILLDTKTKQKSAYITGSNKVTYSAFMHEIDEAFLEIKPRLYTKINVKFNKIYSPNIRANSVTFTDIVLNLEEYNKTENKADYKNKIQIEVDL